MENSPPPDDTSAAPPAAPPFPAAPAALQVLRLSARGRAPVCRLPQGWLTVLLPLTGHLQLRAGEDFWSLPARHLLV